MRKKLAITAFFAMTVCCCNMANAQSHAVDTALVQMATGRVADHVIPKVDDVADMGIERSRYNVKYPSSWRVWKSTLTNGEAIINFFVVKPPSREEKLQTHQTFVSTEAHKGIAKDKGAVYLASDYFTSKSGYDILKISMFKEKYAPGHDAYMAVYFVMVNGSTTITSTAVALENGRDSVVEERYGLLFDAIVRTVARIRD